MGNKVRYLPGCCAFIRYTILALVSIIVAHQTFGAVVINGFPPPGYVKVIVDAPDTIKSAVQWKIADNPSNLVFSDWLNNGDTATVSAGSYPLSAGGYNYIAFRPIAGWSMPAMQQLWVSAYSTNTLFGSCSFASLSGDYQGLFSEDSGPSFESSGFCEISGGRSSVFTGKISSGGQRYSFSGSFDQSGNAWTTIPRAGASPLSVHLVAGEDTVTGEISDETWKATVLAKRNTFDPRANPAGRAGKYTFAFLGGTNSATQPGGDSIGTITVNRSGAITLAVTLSDGTRATQKTFLSKDGQLPFYLPLYSGKGFAFGWLQLQSPSDSGLSEVELHEHCNYAGSWAWMPLGDYDYSQLPSDFHYIDPTSWSVKIAYGKMITLYTNDHFGGFGFTTTTNVTCLTLGYLRSVRVGINVDLLPDFGTITWMRPPDARAKYYPAGFTNQMQAFVSKYQFTTQAGVLEYTVGQGIFQNGNPSDSLTNEFSIDSSGRIAGPNNLNLIIAGSGSFKGSARNPLTGRVISFSGVVLQQQQFARGFFLDADQSGSVYFGPHITRMD